MARYVSQIVHEWNKCKDCPFSEVWSEDDGFGMREIPVGYTCGKGNYNALRYKDVPNCIPLWCEFSDNKRTGKESFEEYLDLSDEEILTFKNYLKNKRNKENVK